VVGQRLYLFYSEQTRASFLADPGSIIDTAERKWPEVARNKRSLPVRRCRSAGISPGNESRHPKVFGNAAVR
jgi:hypothetical protein